MLQIKMEPQYHGLFRFHFKAKQPLGDYAAAPHIDYRGLKGGFKWSIYFNVNK